MASGPGKYDDLCTTVRDLARSEGAAVIVINGCLGSGFSVQLTEGLRLAMPAMLRLLADQIEAGDAE